MNKPRVLIVHPRARPSGGGNLVAAWTLEALREVLLDSETLLEARGETRRTTV